MIKIELTGFEALQFITWKNSIIRSINNGYEPLKFGDKSKMIKVVESIDRQIQSEFFKDVTVGSMSRSNIEELSRLNKNIK